MSPDFFLTRIQPEAGVCEAGAACGLASEAARAMTEWRIDPNDVVTHCISLDGLARAITEFHTNGSCPDLFDRNGILTDVGMRFSDEIHAVGFVKLSDNRIANFVE